MTHMVKIVFYEETFKRSIIDILAEKSYLYTILEKMILKAPYSPNTYYMRHFVFLLPLLCVVWCLSCQSARQQDQVLGPKFRTQLLDDQVQIGYGLGIGDVDGDGQQDILLADKKQFVWYRNGDWQRFVMIDSLTEKDNVCLAVRDIDGDGRVEVAVGAQWNPGETTDSTRSGSVHYLIRPEDPTQLWSAVALPHEPTVHRMQWLKVGDKYQLIVLPLHGRGNQKGVGEGVKVYAYEMPENPEDSWTQQLLDQSMHQTHNFDIYSDNGREVLLIGGKEGAKTIADGRKVKMEIEDFGFGEIRKNGDLIYGIQPIHGNELVVYRPDGTRKVLSDSLQQGHALAIADLLQQGQDQVIVGWRNKNDQEELGIKLFKANDPLWGTWTSSWIDQNGMACEDLKIADLNGDGKQDIIAAGRKTKNLKIYWNESY